MGTGSQLICENLICTALWAKNGKILCQKYFQFFHFGVCDFTIFFLSIFNSLCVVSRNLNVSKSSHGFFHKFHVNSHKFGNKCLQMKYSFVSFGKSMFIFCGKFSQLSLEFTIAILPM